MKKQLLIAAVIVISSLILHYLTAPMFFGLSVSLVLIGFIAIIRFLAFFPDRKSTRLNSSHVAISYAVFCLKKKNTIKKSFGYVFVLCSNYSIQHQVEHPPPL